MNYTHRVFLLQLTGSSSPFLNLSFFFLSFLLSLPQGKSVSQKEQKVKRWGRTSLTFPLQGGCLRLRFKSTHNLVFADLIILPLRKSKFSAFVKENPGEGKTKESLCIAGCGFLLKKDFTAGY